MDEFMSSTYCLIIPSAVFPHIARILETLAWWDSQKYTPEPGIEMHILEANASIHGNGQVLQEAHEWLMAQKVAHNIYLDENQERVLHFYRIRHGSWTVTTLHSTQDERVLFTQEDMRYANRVAMRLMVRP